MAKIIFGNMCGVSCLGSTYPVFNDLLIFHETQFWKTEYEFIFFFDRMNSTIFSNLSNGFAPEITM